MKQKIRVFQLTAKKKVKLRFYGPFGANSGTIGNIKIDEYFDRLNLDEQRAIIWHELYHRKNMTGLIRCYWIILELFTKNKSRWIEEFNADKYSAKMCGKEKTLKFLNKAKELYDKKIVEYNPKTHPPISERIKRIQELK